MRIYWQAGKGYASGTGGMIRASYLSVYHILNADTIVITPKALPVITEWLGKEEA